MPKGIYPRKRKNQVQKQVKSLIKKSPKQNKMKLTVILADVDGAARIEQVKVVNIFQAFEQIIAGYLGMPIHEIRIDVGGITVV